MSTPKMKIQPENIEDFIKSMESQGLTVKRGEPLDLIWRLARAADRELTEAYDRIDELERRLGL